MRENANQNNSKYEHFLRSVSFRSHDYPGVILAAFG